MMPWRRISSPSSTEPVEHHISLTRSEALDLVGMTPSARHLDGDDVAPSASISSP